MRTRAAGTAKDVPMAKPSKVKDDEGWATKIEIAKKARSEAIRARKGKPATFTDHMVVNSGRR